MSTLAGGTEGYLDGVGKKAKFFHPTGLTFDHRAKIIYVTDQVTVFYMAELIHDERKHVVKKFLANVGDICATLFANVY